MNHYSSAAPLISDEDLKEDLVEALRSTAILADVTIGTWSGERSDKAAMEKLAQSEGAQANSGRVLKNLMTGADAKLKAARAAFAAVRAAHVTLTQPWVSNPQASRVTGPRLLPNVLFMSYCERIAKARSAATAALDDMLASYDEDVATAQQNLGGLADAEYPTADQVRAMFYVRMEFEPLPAATDFRNLPPRLVEQLGGALRKRQEAMMQGAQAHAWGELRERATHMRDRMQMVDAKFKASTVTQTQALIELLPAWNIAGDERLVQATDTLRDLVATVTPDDLRSDGALRARVETGLTALIAQMDAWGV